VVVVGSWKSRLLQFGPWNTVLNNMTVWSMRTLAIDRDSKLLECCVHNMVARQEWVSVGYADQCRMGEFWTKHLRSIENVALKTHRHHHHSVRDCLPVPTTD